MLSTFTARFSRASMLFGFSALVYFAAAYAPSNAYAVECPCFRAADIVAKCAPYRNPKRFGSNIWRSTGEWAGKDTKKTVICGSRAVDSNGHRVSRIVYSSGFSAGKPNQSTYNFRQGYCMVRGAASVVKRVYKTFSYLASPRGWKTLRCKPNPRNTRNYRVVWVNGKRICQRRYHSARLTTVRARMRACWREMNTACEQLGYGRENNCVYYK